MEDDITFMTREQYIDMLIDASFKDAAELKLGFMDWCQQRVPLWRLHGRDELWIRQRIEMAQTTHHLHRTLKEQGLSMLEIRDELYKAYTGYPELYDLAREREHLHPGLLRYRGTTSDFLHRYTLRVLVYETDKQAYEKFCRWRGLPTPESGCVFLERPDDRRVIRDLSTVEELELALAMTQYMLQLLDMPENLTPTQIPLLMETYGKQLRAAFIAQHNYRPEDSTTPYVPVTIDGPQDHHAYYTKEYR